jgi:hypothetical protein
MHVRVQRVKPGVGIVHSAERELEESQGAARLQVRVRQTDAFGQAERFVGRLSRSVSATGTRLDLRARGRCERALDIL